VRSSALVDTSESEAVCCSAAAETFATSSEVWSLSAAASSTIDRTPSVELACSVVARSISWIPRFASSMPSTMSSSAVSASSTVSVPLETRSPT
jgi:hypothetical protein